MRTNYILKREATASKSCPKKESEIKELVTTGVCVLVGTSDSCTKECGQTTFSSGSYCCDSSSGSSGQSSNASISDSEIPIPTLSQVAKASASKSCPKKESEIKELLTTGVCVLVGSTDSCTKACGQTTFSSGSYCCDESSGSSGQSSNASISDSDIPIPTLSQVAKASASKSCPKKESE